METARRVTLEAVAERLVEVANATLAIVKTVRVKAAHVRVVHVKTVRVPMVHVVEAEMGPIDV